MRLDRRHFARSQDLQGEGARQLGPFATMRLPDAGGRRALHAPNTSSASFWIGPSVAAGQKDRPSAGRGVLDIVPPPRAGGVATEASRRGRGLAINAPSTMLRI